MRRTLGQIYVSLAPPIAAGILNMIWVKMPVAKSWARPLDRERTWIDGRRVLGDNKTWKGFAGMVGLGALSGLGSGALQRGRRAESLNLFYARRPNTPAYSALVGGLLGLGYAVAELPNSFLKRRFDVLPGKTASGSGKWAFVTLDQVDSVAGCAIVLALLVPGLSPRFLAAVIVTGGLTHLALVNVLYAAGLRRNRL